MWSVDGPPKLKHFLWRASKGSLAVKERLQSRHIILDAACSICRAAGDSISYVNIYCTHAQPIWNGSTLKELINQVPPLSFAEILVWMSSKVSKTEFLIFSTLCWTAWYARYLVVFESTFLRPLDISIGMTKMVADNGVYARRVFGPICRRFFSMDPTGGRVYKTESGCTCNGRGGSGP